MYLGEAPALLTPELRAKAATLPWWLAFSPERGWVNVNGSAWTPSMGDTDMDVPGQQPFIAGGMAAKDALARAGYTGPVAQGYDVKISGNVTVSGSPEVVSRLGPSPALTDFLRSNGYTLKVARTEANSMRTLFGSLWKNGELVDMSGYDWSTKTSMFEKIVVGTLIAMVGGAAVIAATGGAAASGAAAAATPAASVAPVAAAAPAVSTALPAAAAAIPSVSTAGAGAGLLTTAIKAAPVVATVAKAALPIMQAQQAVQAAEAKAALQTATQMPIAPPANMLPSSPVRYDATVFQSSQPSWLIPVVAIGGGALLLTLLMSRRFK